MIFNNAPWGLLVVVVSFNGFSDTRKRFDMAHSVEVLSISLPLVCWSSDVCSEL